MEFCHKAINDEWDRTRTLKQNYRKMGLSTDAQSALPIKKGDVLRKASAQSDKDVGVASGVLEELDQIANLPTPEPYQVKVSACAWQKH